MDDAVATSKGMFKLTLLYIYIYRLGIISYFKFPSFFFSITSERTFHRYTWYFSSIFQERSYCKGFIIVDSNTRRETKVGFKGCPSLLFIYKFCNKSNLLSCIHWPSPHSFTSFLDSIFRREVHHLNWRISVLLQKMFRFTSTWKSIM